TAGRRAARRDAGDACAHAQVGSALLALERGHVPVVLDREVLLLEGGGAVAHGAALRGDGGGGAEGGPGEGTLRGGPGAGGGGEGATEASCGARETAPEEAAARGCELERVCGTRLWRDAATSRAASRSCASKPVAMTVTFTFSPIVSSMLAPKMMLASSWACS